MGQPNPTAPYEGEDIKRILTENTDNDGHGPGDLENVPESDTELEVEA